MEVGNRGRLLELEPTAGDRELVQVDSMLLKTHRDNWSDVTSIGRAKLYRDRYKDVAVDLANPEARAELLRASAGKAIEVHESAREELEAHGLTVTAAGAVVAVKLVDLEPGEQLAEVDPDGTTEPSAEPGDDDQDDDQDGDELDAVTGPDRDAPTPASSPAVRRGGRKPGRKGGRG